MQMSPLGRTSAQSRAWPIVALLWRPAWPSQAWPRRFPRRSGRWWDCPGGAGPLAFSWPSPAWKNSVRAFFVAFSWPSFCQWANFTRTCPRTIPDILRAPQMKMWGFEAKKGQKVHPNFAPTLPCFLHCHAFFFPLPNTPRLF